MLRCIVCIMLMSVCTPIMACDVCACSSGSFSSGFMTIRNQHLLGLSYASRSFQSEHPTLFEGETPVVSDERFQTLQWSARFFPIRNLQLMAFVPYNFFQKQEEGETVRTQGLGDITLTAHAVLFSRNDSGRFQHRITGGGGLKLPTGESQIEADEQGILIPSMQPGTGSLDYLLSLGYMVQHKLWGTSTEISYRINQANDNYYEFGDRLNVSVDVFRNFMLADDRALLRPQIGLLLDESAQDNRNTRINDMNEYSGGTVLETRVGLNAQWKNWVCGVTYSFPIHQHLGGGYITVKPQSTIQLNYLIQTK